MPKRKRRSFYANVLDEAERQELKAAAALDGIDDEIALMRFHIKQLARTTSTDDLTRCMNSLCRLVSTRYNVTKHEKKGIREAMTTVLRDIALPLGIKILDKKL